MRHLPGAATYTIRGDSDREPLHNALDQAWYVAGVNAATAAVAALFQRLFTGRGQQVEVSASECLAAHMVQAVPYFNYMGAIKGRRPIRGSGFEELMPARDGYVVPSVQGSQPWSVVADLIGLEELGNEKFSSGSGRIEHGEELKELVARGLARWDRKPLFEASGQRRLVFGMAQDSGDLYACPHLEERGYFVPVDHPVAGTAQYAGFGPRLSSDRYEVTRPAPLLGQHNQEDLRPPPGPHGPGPGLSEGGWHRLTAPHLCPNSNPDPLQECRAPPRMKND